MVLHGLAGEHILDVGDGASGLGHEGTAREDGEALLGGVEHLLHTRKHTGDVWRDQRVL